MCIADCHGKELRRALSLLPRYADDANPENGRKAARPAGECSFNEPFCQSPAATDRPSSALPI